MFVNVALIGKMTNNSSGGASSVEPVWQDKVDSSAAMLQQLLSREEFCDVMFRLFRAGSAGQTEDIKAYR